MRRAIFLDKDGTLVENVPYNVDCQQIRLTHRAGEALRRWHRQGYALVVVTNQPGVALGYFDRQAVRCVALRLQQRPQAAGATQSARPRPSAHAVVQPLSARELEVLAEMVAGKTNHEIAAALYMSPKTAMHHTGHIYRKLGLRGRAQAVAFAIEHGLVAGR